MKNDWNQCSEPLQAKQNPQQPIEFSILNMVLQYSLEIFKGFGKISATIDEGKTYDNGLTVRARRIYHLNSARAESGEIGIRNRLSSGGIHSFKA
jgi:hypothetical protein